MLRLHPISGSQDAAGDGAHAAAEGVPSSGAYLKMTSRRPLQRRVWLQTRYGGSVFSMCVHAPAHGWGHCVLCEVARCEPDGMLARRWRHCWRGESPLATFGAAPKARGHHDAGSWRRIARISRCGRIAAGGPNLASRGGLINALPSSRQRSALSAADQQPAAPLLSAPIQTAPSTAPPAP